MAAKNAEPKKHGRPSKFTPEIAQAICDRLAKGEPLLRICAEDGMPADRTVRDWLAINDQFSADYARAREVGMDAIALEALDIADDSTRDVIRNEDGSERVNAEHVSRSKLRVETRLKLLACWDPKRYGTQRVEHGGEMTVKHDESALLNQANALLAKMGGA